MASLMAALVFGVPAVVDAQSDPVGTLPQAAAFATILDEGRDEERAAVVARIASLGPGSISPRGASSLVAIARNEVYAVETRRRAIQALSWVEPRAAWWEPIRHIATLGGDAEVRAAAIWLLGRWAPRDRRTRAAILERLMVAPTMVERRAAIQAASRLNGVDDALLEELPRATDDGFIRVAYVFALRGVARPDLSARLEQLAAGDDAVSGDALVALAFHDPSRARHAAEGRLSEVDPELAIRVLTALDSADSAHLILDAYERTPERLLVATSEYLRRVEIAGARGRAAHLFASQLSSARGMLAAEVLASMGASGEAELVARALDPEREGRVAALVGLAAVEHPRVVVPLGEIVVDRASQVDVRAAAAEALRGRRQVYVRARLEEATQAAKSPEFLKSAAGALGSVGACEALAGLLNADDAEVRIVAAMALPRCGDSPEFTIRRLLESSLAPRDVGRAIAQIPNLSDEGLVTYFGDADASARSAVAEAIAERGGPVSLLSECAQDSSWQVRRVCVTGLGRVDSSADVIDLLLAATHDEESGVRRAALGGLKRRTPLDDRVVSRVSDLIRSEPRMTPLAIEVLGAASAGEELLRRGLASNDSMVRLRAVEALSRFERLSEESVNALLSVSAEESSQAVRDATMRALEATGELSALRPTLGRIEEGEWQVFVIDGALRDFQEAYRGY